MHFGTLVKTSPTWRPDSAVARGRCYSRKNNSGMGEIFYALEYPLNKNSPNFNFPVQLFKA